MVRLLERHKKEIVPRMMRKFGYKNQMAVPRLEKIVVNMGVGEAVQDKKFLEGASRDLAAITGQKPLITRAKKSVSGFQVRKGMPIGCKVTLRGKRMYEFLDRLISVALPRIRDFRGLSPEGFDARGNYNLGISDELVFPEVDVEKVEMPLGFNIAICIRGSSPEESRELLTAFGLPLRKK